MFARRYFAGRYFAPRYFPAGLGVVVPIDPLDPAIDDDSAEDFTGGLSVRYTSYEAVVKSDTVNLDFPASALYVGGAGVVVLVGDDDLPIPFTVPAGKTLSNIKFKRVNSTNTTATLMVAMR